MSGLPEAAPTVLYLLSHWAPPMAPSVNNRLLQSSSYLLPLAISVFSTQPRRFKRSQPEIIEFRSINIESASRLIGSCEWIYVLLLQVLFLSTITLLAASLPTPLFCSHNNTIYNTIH